jgi:DNA mismatch repair ATPase MutS
VLLRLEREPLESELLAALKARIATGGVPASKQIAKLRRLIEYRDQANNQMFAIIAEPLLWSPQFAFAIERWRQTSGPHIGEWIQAVGEIEALSSIAGYASEHPEDPFPELTGEGPLFDAQGIGHPLIPPQAAVRNDVRLDREMRLLLVSGSNMSGKSTLLRSVGLNTVLAWAGAPVRAVRLRLSPLAVGAAMRAQDSLVDGKSRFYAEITRLRGVVDLIDGPVPLLFLLDEILSGTNSHDRLIGAAAVVKNLVQRGSIGLVTTHDLALAHIADDLAPNAANVHFEDHIEDGRIAFDYRMRPGVVRKSNALELMRSVGLDV